MALIEKTLPELESEVRLSSPVWFRGGDWLPLVFTIGGGPTFFGLNFDIFFDPATGLISAAALPAGSTPVTLDANADLVLSLTGQEIGLDDQVANTVFAGPAAGGATTPILRALVDADIPAAILRDAEHTAIGAAAPHHASFIQADADLLYDVLGGLAAHLGVDSHHSEAHVLNTSGPHTGPLQWSDVVADIVNADVNAAAAILESKLSLNFATHAELHAAAEHNAAVLMAGANENLGAYYLDIDDIAVPANPGAGVRRLFVNTVTGELSVRTNAGATVSLEGAGGGGMATDPLWDALGDLAYGTGADTGAKLAGDTSNTRKFLRELSVGGTATAPVWDTLLAADIPDISATYQVVSEKAAANGYMGLDANQYGTDPPQAHPHLAAGSGGALYSVHQYAFGNDDGIGEDVTVGRLVSIIPTSGGAEAVKRITINALTTPASGNLVLNIEESDAEDLSGAGWANKKTVTFVATGADPDSYIDTNPGISLTARRQISINVTTAPAGWEDVTIAIEVWRALEG